MTRPVECLATMWRGCRWEGRYDHVTAPEASDLPPLMSGDVKSLVSRETYVRDVCRRCGATKERAPHA